MAFELWGRTYLLNTRDLNSRDRMILGKEKLVLFVCVISDFCFFFLSIIRSELVLLKTMILMFVLHGGRCHLYFGS